MEKSILIIQTASLGDVILATSLLETIHKNYPDFKLDFLIKKEYSELFNSHPYLNKLLLFDRKRNKFKELLRLKKEITQNKYYAAITVQRFFSSGFLCTFSKADYKVGFNKNPFSLFFTHKIPHQQVNCHEIERNFKLLSFLNISKVELPKLYPSVENYFNISKYVYEPYICIAVGSLWQTKKLPPEKWVSFLNSIPYDLNLIFIGGSKDYDLSQSIIEQVNAKKCVNLCGKLKLLDTAALLEKTIMLYTNDSAPAHIASAMNANVTVVYCSTIPEFGFTPLSKHSYVVQTAEKLNCRPCGLHGRRNCPEKHFACGNSINIEDLQNTLKEVLK